MTISSLNVFRRNIVYALLINLSTTSDIICNWLFKAINMRFTKLSEKVVLIKILESFYHDTSNSLAEIPKNVIALFAGVHQDGPESPPVYNLNM